MNKRIQPTRAGTIDAFRQSYEVLSNSSTRTGKDTRQEARLNDIRLLVEHMEMVQSRCTLPAHTIIIPLEKKAKVFSLEAVFSAARAMTLTLL